MCLGLAVLVAALALAPGVLAGGDLALVVDVPGNGRELYRENVVAGATFVLSYVHSSEHVPVRGTFRVEGNGRLTIVETAFGGFGPGLPELGPGDDWHVEDGMIVYRPRQTSLSELVVRVAPETRHRFIGPDGRMIDLSAAVPPGAAVRIRVRR